VAIDLAGIPGGAGDGQIDTIFIDGTSGDDVITFSNENGVITVHGLAAEIVLTGFDANDRIVINGLAGDDVIDASGLSGMLLTGHGGDGDDILIGSAAADVLTGGAGDDVLIGGGGLDVLDGGTGDNVVIQSVVPFEPPSFLGGASDGRAGVPASPMRPPPCPPGWLRRTFARIRDSRTSSVPRRKFLHDALRRSRAAFACIACFQEPSTS